MRDGVGCTGIMRWDYGYKVHLCDKGEVERGKEREGEREEREEREEKRWVRVRAALGPPPKGEKRERRERMGVMGFVEG